MNVCQREQNHTTPSEVHSSPCSLSCAPIYSNVPLRIPTYSYVFTSRAMFAGCFPLTKKLLCSRPVGICLNALCLFTEKMLQTSKAPRGGGKLIGSAPRTRVLRLCVYVCVCFLKQTFFFSHVRVAFSAHRAAPRQHLLYYYYYRLGAPRFSGYLTLLLCIQSLAIASVSTSAPAPAFKRP